ncbi:hypothetical protein Dimus_006969 [Dionaea muscipula]
MPSSTTRRESKTERNGQVSHTWAGHGCARGHGPAVCSSELLVQRGRIKTCEYLALALAGTDKAKLEEMKGECVRIHEEVDKEREMLRIADTLREERAQMKLSEAKHHYKERNLAVDKLIIEALILTAGKEEAQSGDLARRPDSVGFCPGHDQENEKVDDGFEHGEGEGFALAKSELQLLLSIDSNSVVADDVRALDKKLVVTTEKKKKKKKLWGS